MGYLPNPSQPSLVMTTPGAHRGWYAVSPAYRAHVDGGIEIPDTQRPLGRGSYSNSLRLSCGTPQNTCARVSPEKCRCHAGLGSRVLKQRNGPWSTSAWVQMLYHLPAVSPWVRYLTSLPAQALPLHFWVMTIYLIEFL